MLFGNMSSASRHGGAWLNHKFYFLTPHRSNLNLLATNLVPPCIDGPNTLCCQNFLLQGSLLFAFSEDTLSMFKGAGRIGVTAGVRVPRRLDNSPTVTYTICKSFWHHLEIDSTFSLGRDNVISTESINILKNSRFFGSCRIDFFIFLTKPIFCNRKMTVSVLIITSSRVLPRIRKSSN